MIMDGGNKVIGLWRGREGAATTAEGVRADPSPYLPIEGEDEAQPRDWRRQLELGACVILGAAWIGLVAWSQMPIWLERMLTLPEIVSLIMTISAPLALLGVTWMLLQRSSKAEADRFARTAHALRVESERLDSVLSFVSARIDASRRELSDQGDALLSLGNDAALRMTAVGEAMRKEIDVISSNSQTLKGTAAAARGDLAVILSHLPKAQVQMRQIAASLVEAGNSAQDKTIALSEAVNELGAKTVDALSLADGSGRQLVERLAAIETSSEALAGLIEESQAKLVTKADEQTEALATRIRGIGAEVDRISGSFAAQDESSRALMTRISADLGALETRFAAFDTHRQERAEQLSQSLCTLRNDAGTLQDALAAGDGTIETLKTKTEALIAALDTASREIDETLPAAYARLGQTADQALQAVGRAGPALADVANASNALLDNMTATEALVLAQRTALEQAAGLSDDVLTKCKVEAEELAESLSVAQAELQSFATGAGPSLIASLVQARDTAQQAANHARDAFNNAIPQAATSFGEQSKKALGDALTAQVEVQMKEVAATTEQAVAAAQKATDRLMRQMLTISETSSALEARIAEAKDEAERGDQSNFARRVALLIESLNSSAIDVTKILSNDVTDTAWASYLRGDRGVFARRAVKLLDTNEAKEIARFYADDSDFREQVNRYIHDYESMLRNVMATRDGMPLSVALLSSDTGKLYVALAQAIERLRT